MIVNVGTCCPASCGARIARDCTASVVPLRRKTSSGLAVTGCGTLVVDEVLLRTTITEMMARTTVTEANTIQSCRRERGSLTGGNAGCDSNWSRVEPGSGVTS